ncbi:DUF222 domain-containing protein [Amnibacterium flavum]|nr:HNH endonuclease signature motif containing protein [Amnibacterium flavum]
MSQAYGEATQASPGLALVDALADGVVVEREFAARRYEQIDAVRGWYEAEHGALWSRPDALEWRDLRAEIAAALVIHERTAEAQLHYARRLVHDFPTTLGRLREARFSDRHARVVVDCSVGVPPELLADYEAQVLELAERMPAPRFEKQAAFVAAAISPSTMVAQHAEAMTERRIAVEPAPHGMAWLHILQDAPLIVGAKAAITGLALTLHGVPGETRTLSQIEADVAGDLLGDSFGLTSTISGGEPVPSPAAQRGVKAEVFIHVSAGTALGISEEPGHLRGYGPIDHETARKLAGTASSWIRLLTDPADGTILDFGRSTYRPPVELRRYVQVRDQVCRFVGCTRSAEHCDIDHTVAWIDDGETTAANLEALCKSHHPVKTRGRWQVEMDPNGVVHWTSPTGRTYETYPAAVIRPPGDVRFRPVVDESDASDDLVDGAEPRPSAIGDALARKFKVGEKPKAAPKPDGPTLADWFVDADEGSGGPSGRDADDLAG